MPDAEFYRQLEGHLETSLVGLPPEWTDEERAEVQEMINVGEYGVALETLAGIAVEENRPLSPDLIFLIEKLAERMELGGAEPVRRLHKHLGTRTTSVRVRKRQIAPVPRH